MSEALVSVFDTHGTLLYTARSSDSDVQATRAAVRRGVQLPKHVVIHRTGYPAITYEVVSEGRVLVPA